MSETTFSVRDYFFVGDDFFWQKRPFLVGYVFFYRWRLFFVEDDLFFGSKTTFFFGDDFFFVGATFLSKNFNEREEGCLSIPGHHAIVKRPDKVIVNYRDENFKQKELEADDLLGVCIQHEIDHLNGILFIDHLSRIKKEMILKKIKKENLNENRS